MECHQEDELPEGEPQIVSPEGGDQAGERDKLFAARMIERLERKHRFVEDQFATSSRWLAASLLAVNSGGALAVANAARQSDAIACPGLCFLFGVVSALASGAVIQELYSRMTPLLAEQDDYWITIKIGEPRDRAREDELKEAALRAARWNWCAPALGWLSGTLFLAGALSLGAAAMAQRDTNPDHEHLPAARPARAMPADRRPALKRQT